MVRDCGDSKIGRLEACFHRQKFSKLVTPENKLFGAESESCNCVRFFATPWTIAYQAPLSMEFSRQEYWSGLPYPSPGDLPDPGIKPTSLGSLALAGGFFTTVPPGRPILLIRYTQIKENRLQLNSDMPSVRLQSSLKTVKIGEESIL